jgi:hypothetical protein
VASRESIIESLLLKGSPKYNSNKDEREACIKKAQELASKYNLQWEFDRCYKKLFLETTPKQSWHDESNLADADWINYDFAKKYQEKKKTVEFMDFFSFQCKFYQNVNGNRVFKIHNGDRYIYITIVECINGSWGVMYERQPCFFRHKSEAYEHAYKIYKSLNLEYNEEREWWDNGEY